MKFKKHTTVNDNNFNPSLGIGIILFFLLSEFVIALEGGKGRHLRVKSIIAVRGSNNAQCQGRR